MKSALQVLIILGIGVSGGFAAGYSKSREKFLEAMVHGLTSSVKEEKSESEEES